GRAKRASIGSLLWPRMSVGGGGSWSNCSRVAAKPAQHQGHVGSPPRVAFFVAPPCRADRSCGHAGLGAMSGGDGGRAPIERRPPLRGGEQRITGDARGTPPRRDSSKNVNVQISSASYGAEN